jgi:hypothetical protein
MTIPRKTKIIGAAAIISAVVVTASPMPLALLALLRHGDKRRTAPVGTVG